MNRDRFTTLLSEHSTPEMLSMHLRLNHATPALCRTIDNFRMPTTALYYIGGEGHRARKRKIIYWLPQRNAVLRVHGSIIYFFLLPSFLNFCIYYTKFLMPCQEISYVFVKIISRKMVGLLSDNPTFID